MLAEPCAACARRPSRHATGDGRAACTRCYIRSRAVVHRALITALVVGSLLTLLNQGDVLLGGDLPPALLWKIPLTYAVPYAVTTWGALTR